MIELYFFIELNSFGFYEHYGVLARILSVYRTLGQYSIYPEQKDVAPSLQRQIRTRLISARGDGVVAQ
jgi:hypothetical protein